MIKTSNDFKLCELIAPNTWRIIAEGNKSAMKKEARSIKTDFPAITLNTFVSYHRTIGDCIKTNL
jgi:hypothetical protein